MDNRGQVAGNTLIWGAGAILLMIGLIVFLSSFRERAAGLSLLAEVETFVGIVLLIFAVTSFYMAHK